MKMQFYAKDAEIIRAFLARWMTDNEIALMLLALDECEPFYFACDSVELANCFMELEEKGFTQSVKEVFQGNHFYRSDTGQCPRCRRYRPEIHWNNENIPKEHKAELCDRCFDVLKQVAKGEAHGGKPPHIRLDGFFEPWRERPPPFFARDT